MRPWSCRPAFHLTARTANAVAGMADPSRNIWAVQFHPEVRHTPQGTDAAAQFSLQHLPCPAQLDAGALHPVHRFRHPRAGGRRPRHLRAFRRRRFLRGRGAGGARHRRPADLRLCQQRRAAQERVLQGAAKHARQAGAAIWLPWTRAIASCPGWPASPIPKQKRKIIGREFIAVFDDEAKRILEQQQQAKRSPGWCRARSIPM